jgi:hypothetical protein
MVTQMTMRLSGIALAGLLVALGVAGCGGDDGETTSSTKKDDKDDDKKPAQMKGCGPKVCTADKDFMGELCCKSQFEGICGQMVAGTCSDLPPPSHPKCDGTAFMVMGTPVTVPSCCTNNDECGLVFNAGFGSPMCTSLTQAARFNPMFSGGMGMQFMFTGMLPSPKKCSTGEAIEVPMGAAGSGS